MVKVDDQTETRLKELAEAEMTAARERLKKRTVAAREFSAASNRLEEGAATWERIQGETTTAKAQAVGDLIASDMTPTEVSQLLSIDIRQVRSLQGTATAKPPVSGTQAPPRSRPEPKANAHDRPDPSAPDPAAHDGQTSAA